MLVHDALAQKAMVVFVSSALLLGYPLLPCCITLPVTLLKDTP